MLSSLLLGLIQGLTEFLPVSSSGHLVLVQQFMDIGEDVILFDLILHVGTLLPVLWFYRADVLGVLRDLFVGTGPFWERQGVRLALMVVIASIPTGIIGLALEDVFEALFANPASLSVTFAITGFLLYFSGKFPNKGTTLSEMSWKSAAILGIAQGIAITPGISRSGTTIAVALMLGIDRELAARLSFLMSVPAITGAVILKLGDANLAEARWAEMGAGAATAMVAGYAALWMLVYIVKGGKFQYFSWYVWGMSVVAGIIAFLAP